MAYIDDKGLLLKVRYFADNAKYTCQERWPKTPQGWADAKLKLREVDKRIAYAEPVSKWTDLTTEEVGARWLIAKSKESDKKAYAKNAKRRWDIACEQNGWGKISQITAASVAKWRDGGWKVGAARIVRAILHWAQGAPCEQAIPESVFATMDIPDGHNTDPLMEEWEVNLVQRKADKEGDMAGLMVYLYQNYASRPATMARIKVGDVDLKRQVVTTWVKKGRGGVRRHEVPLDVDAELLQRFQRVVENRQPAEPLFIHPMTGQGFSEEHGHHRSACIWLNRHHGATYGLKRYAMSNMRERGLDNTQVMAITGHLSEEAVNRYMKSNLSKARAAMSKLRQPTPPTPPNNGQTTVQGVGLGLVRNDRSDTMSSDDDGENSGKILHFPMRRAT